ncbi:MAG TPA: nucleoside 2-deoxyribosyltransferase [Anaerolineae bacterium]|nr:nucleoside 2-deoxyribosyltransferase [Anaerolineae bacterium]
MRVYCAGPLFSEGERREMADIADALEKAGHETFLPQRDGIHIAAVCGELTAMTGARDTEVARFLERAVFALDVRQVERACDAIVVNLNGRVPDEGAVVEMAIAWANQKPVVAYIDESRSFAGMANPLVAGLYDFQLVTTIGDIPNALEQVAAMPPGNRALAGSSAMGDMLCQRIPSCNGEKLAVLAEVFRTSWREESGG